METSQFLESIKEQHQEGLLRMRIWARLKGGDIKGAQSLALPALKKVLEREKAGQPIPVGWLSVSQALCARDIQSYGIAEGVADAEPPKERTWVEKALEIVSSRLKGIFKALVPATLALALMAQVLGPTIVAAQSPQFFGRVPDQVTLTTEDISAQGKLQIEVQSEVDHDAVLAPNPENPELSWHLEDRGEGAMVAQSTTSLRASALMEGESLGKEPSLVWSLENVVIKPELGGRETTLVVENISSAPAHVAHFSVGDARYEGCSLKLSDSVSQEFNQYRSPSEIPAHTKAVYKLSMKEGTMPTIIFSTTKGEKHSMHLKLQDLDKLSQNMGQKTWVTFSAINKSQSPVEVSPQTPAEGVELAFVQINDKPSGADKSGPVLVKAGEKITYMVLAKKGINPSIALKAKSTVTKKTSIYKLKSPDDLSFADTATQLYKKLLALVFGDAKSPMNWDQMYKASVAHGVGMPSKPMLVFEDQAFEEALKAEDLDQMRSDIAVEQIRKVVESSGPSKVSKEAVEAAKHLGAKGAEEKAPVEIRKAIRVLKPSEEREQGSSGVLKMLKDYEQSLSPQELDAIAKEARNSVEGIPAVR